MAYADFETLSVEVADGIAQVVIDHPPVNLLDLAMIRDLDRLGRELAVDDAVRVTLFRSANPDFFIAHADVELIQALPRDDTGRHDELSFFHRMVERFRRLPSVTIGVIEGRARGGGSEFLLSLDLRFAALGRARMAQPEVALGIIPGGGGTQHLARLLGRGRALEAILGCEDFDAELAERYGWVNRALPGDEVLPFARRLARRIASFPAAAVALAKQSVDAAAGDLHAGLLEEDHLFRRAAASDEARERMQAFMASGGQTPERELELRFE